MPFEKLVVAHLIRKFISCYGTRRRVTGAITREATHVERNIEVPSRNRCYGQTDRCDKANSRFLQFCESV
jgi:hypothetical protein